MRQRSDLEDENAASYLPSVNSCEFFPPPHKSYFNNNIMFIPKNEAAAAETREADQARREAYSRIEAWVMDAIPANYRRGAIVSVQEVVCGDPNCSPVDTAIAILFEG